jgi:hypothetical protein
MARIEPDDRKTWPAEVAEFVRRAAGAVRGTVQHDYEIDAPEAEERFLEVLRGSTIRAYHCTRLLKHELAAIRARGLRRLTEGLVLERIDRALECKAITQAEAEQFRKGHAFAAGEEEHREGKVCLFSYRQTMDDTHSVKDLLGIWGGEAIYLHVGTEWEDRIRTLGRPAIIAVDVDVTQEPRGRRSTTSARACSRSAGPGGGARIGVPAEAARGDGAVRSGEGPTWPRPGLHGSPWEPA